MSSRKKNKINPTPLFILVGGGLLLIVAAILLATQNAPVSPTPAAAFEEETYPEIPRVSLDEAKAAFDQGSATFVDVRSAEAYQGGHIAGAINIPLAELEFRLGELDEAQWIITYCT
ncbi:MAG: rhodanese-like domain-containing protein [Anaerolineales bacterium]|nr:rhodanese-like domain-containing protein [Anaerolineales bacterium]